MLRRIPSTIRPITFLTLRPIIPRYSFRAISVAANENGSSSAGAHKGSNGPEQHQWTRLEGMYNHLDSSISTVVKNLGTCKGNIGKSISKLSVSIEKGFMKINAELQETRCAISTGTENTRGQFNARMRPILWAVHMLLGGASVCLYFIIETGLKELVSVKDILASHSHDTDDSASIASPFED